MKIFPEKKRLIIYLVIAGFLYLGWVVLMGASSPRGLELSDEEKASYTVVDRETVKKALKKD